MCISRSLNVHLTTPQGAAGAHESKNLNPKRNNGAPSAAKIGDDAPDEEKDPAWCSRCQGSGDLRHEGNVQTECPDCHGTCRDAGWMALQAKRGKR